MMVRATLRRSGSKALFALLALLAILGGLLWRAIRQARLDADLIDAVRQMDPSEVRTTLVRGADPNAHEPPDVARIASWRSLVDRLRVMVSPPETPSALDVAVELDIQSAPDVYAGPGYLVDLRTAAISSEQEATRSIIETLIRKGARPRSEAPAERPGLDKCTRRLASCPDQLLRTPSETNDTPGMEWIDIWKVCQDNIQTYGACCRAYAEMGECQLRLNNYAMASRSFGLALLWSPSDATARKGKERADAAESASRAIRRLLPGPNISVVAVRPYPTRNDTWVVLTDVGDSDKMSIGLYAMGHEKARRIAGPLRLPSNDGPDENPAEDLLFVCPFSARGRHEIVVDRHQVGGVDGNFCRMDVVVPNAERIVPLVGVTSSFPVGVRRLNRSDAWVFSYRIDAQMKADAQPSWQDIYTFKDVPILLPQSCRTLGRRAGAGAALTVIEATSR